MDPGWKEFDDTTKNEFSLVLEEILKSLQIMESHPDAIRSCTFLLSIMKKPWSHNNLLKLLNGNPSLEEGWLNIWAYFNFLGYLSQKQM